MTDMELGRRDLSIQWHPHKMEDIASGLGLGQGKEDRS